ncbi:MAG: hypothetical protein SOY60_03570 [Fusobacterium gastrosuis]|uniref:hypothetical protein n=1 Tax=Fusobacterium gastrosuis TaxID=1755100 RepID=UPI002A8D180E|nr:hypothetical protein [Fusobacterium gastrosuis]
MSTLELVLNMLAEATTTEITREKKLQTFEENKKVARAGGEVAGNELELINLLLQVKKLRLLSIKRSEL